MSTLLPPKARFPNQQDGARADLTEGKQVCVSIGGIVQRRMLSSRTRDPARCRLQKDRRDRVPGMRMLARPSNLFASRVASPFASVDSTRDDCASLVGVHSMLRTPHACKCRWVSGPLLDECVRPGSVKQAAARMAASALLLSLCASIRDRFSKPPLMLFKDSGAAASPRSGHKSTRLRQKTAE
ncbi:hypothetical protein BDZ90DRAFT_134257 [Jaminaea rosea]|uniref:Uncharacterized protein n=1 Tax=Jaminaea rosea TaxID=1569628 RepID=A0A316UVT6_9BASI|nr:hypothetical protein BDZ90DRAFT_134257 [Jaminaea rosea]PWN28908.1 hypothetical protein BDZ90DRAFT_134257 [Jaminaea rosea]